MPDALSKTVPIWIAVINRLLFPHARESHGFISSASVVSRSEHAQIESRIDDFVRKAQELKLDSNQLGQAVQKALVPCLACQDDPLPSLSSDSDIYPVVCCSVSRKEVDDGDPYIQGGGDDTENWAHGLTSELFWRFRDDLCAEQGDEELEALVQRILKDKASHVAQEPKLVQWTAGSAPLWICNSQYAQNADPESFDAIIV